MDELSKLYKFISISGPTGSGKSKLAEELCRARGSFLVNADSVQSYRYVDIGSAKPSAEDLTGFCSGLFDFIEPFDEWTAPQFLRGVESLIASNPLVKEWILCGGSGFYIRTAEKGIPDIAPSDAHLQKLLQERLENEGSEKLHKELAEYDFDASKKISANDHYRLLRYLESFLATGLTKKQRESESGLAGGLAQKGKFLKIVLDADREWLRDRLLLRTQIMLERGLLEEVSLLLRRGLAKWAPLQSVGYRECVQYLLKRGEVEESVEHNIVRVSEPWVSDIIDEDSLKEVIVRHTLQLAKKQKTWWKRDPDVVWIPAHNSLKEQFASVVDLLNRDTL